MKATNISALASQVAKAMKIFAIANQKGGIGKSTVVVNTAYAASEKGLRVLLVDFDPQHSLSISFPTTAPYDGPTGANMSLMLFAEGAVIQPEVLTPNLSILRGDRTLLELGDLTPEAIKRPRQYLRALAAEYDLCIIDTPGVMGPTTLAALVAAHSVVCPFNPGMYEEEALIYLCDYLQGIKRNGYNPTLKLMGLLPSKVETTSKDEMEDLAKIRKRFGALILPFILGQRISVKTAIRNRKPIWRGTKGAGHLKAAQEWREATEFMLKQLGVV